MSCVMFTFVGNSTQASEDASFEVMRAWTGVVKADRLRPGDTGTAQRMAWVKLEKGVAPEPIVAALKALPEVDPQSVGVPSFRSLDQP